ncbi:hypothetical protein SKAU_G00185080 [Synaphobranchus kaupii]|uniref:Uncharacterized protein n=1 Tax=Synaphobranchus kaupii TaxID=118154 RepID=A0A9Q1FCK1_SYNKA|nr:hypothetical protein SKAU_G00185080 [Synaphobranchus kaupii]
MRFYQISLRENGAYSDLLPEAGGESAYQRVDYICCIGIHAALTTKNTQGVKCNNIHPRRNSWLDRATVQQMQDQI